MPGPRSPETRRCSSRAKETEEVADKQNDVRAQLVQRLVEKVDEDQYPSSTMMDTIEEMLTPDELQQYASVLLAKVADDTYPSLGMIRRIRDLIG